VSKGCPDCDYTGYIPVVINNEKVLKNCECKVKSEEATTWEEKLMEARIPRDYWNLSLEDYQNFATNDEDMRENDASVGNVKRYIFNIPRMVKTGEG